MFYLLTNSNSGEGLIAWIKFNSKGSSSPFNLVFCWWYTMYMLEAYPNWYIEIDPLLYARSPRIRLASWMSLGMMVTLCRKDQCVFGNGWAWGAGCWPAWSLAQHARELIGRGDEWNVVLTLAWMAHKLVSSKRPTKYASEASWRAAIAALWKRKSVLKSWAISRTKRWKGSLRMRSSVLFW